MSKAREEGNTEHFRKDNQSDIEDQIAAARKEWIKSHNDELERRLSNAIQEVRRIWDEEQKVKTKEVRKQRAVFYRQPCYSLVEDASSNYSNSVELLYSVLVVFVIYQLESPTLSGFLWNDSCKDIILSFLSLKKGKFRFCNLHSLKMPLRKNCLKEKNLACVVLLLSSILRKRVAHVPLQIVSYRSNLTNKIIDFDSFPLILSLILTYI